MMSVREFFYGNKPSPTVILKTASAPVTPKRQHAPYSPHSFLSHESPTWRPDDRDAKQACNHNYCATPPRVDPPYSSRYQHHQESSPLPAVTGRYFPAAVHTQESGPLRKESNNAHHYSTPPSNLDSYNSRYQRESQHTPFNGKFQSPSFRFQELSARRPMEETAYHYWSTPNADRYVPRDEQEVELPVSENFLSSAVQYYQNSLRGTSEANVHRVESSPSLHRSHRRAVSYDFSPSNYNGRGNSTPMSQWVELRVPICCEGCVDRVSGNLLNLEGVESVKCDQIRKRVLVKGTAAASQVLKVCKKLFKGSEYWRYQYDWL